MKALAQSRPAIVLGPTRVEPGGRLGRGVGVAVIDSGINPGHPHVGGLGAGIAFDDAARPHGDLLDRLGHGTAIAAAIHEKAPAATIHVARVFHESLSASLEALIAAIDWAIAREARLVNLSLGTGNPDNAPALAAVVGRASAAGTIVVSAREDGRRTWFPGSMAGVVGVTLDQACSRDSAWFATLPEEIRASAAGYPRPIPGLPPERNLQGVSFAVANTTGLLACLLEGRPEVRTTKELAELLATKAAG